jgi:hypothetical protein
MKRTKLPTHASQPPTDVLMVQLFESADANDNRKNTVSNNDSAMNFIFLLLGDFFCKKCS